MIDPQRFPGQVCIVTSHQYPESLGGEETFITQYGRFLSLRDIRHTVVSSSSLPSMPSLDALYIRPFSVPLVGFELYALLWAILAFMRIVKIHSRARISVIHSVETGYGGLASVLAGKLLRRPIVVHSHGRRSVTLKGIRQSIRDWRTWPYWALEKSLDHFVVTRADRCIAVSKQVASFLEEIGVAKSNILIAPSAVEIDKYGKSGNPVGRWRLGAMPDSFIIGYLGRLERLKGVDTLIDAFADFVLKSKKPNLLLLAGDGPMRDELIQSSQQTGLANIRFVGYQSDSVSFFSSLDVFVLPSFYEGSPIALLEALASGCAVVASDITGVREVINGKIPLFPPGNPEALSDLLARLEVDEPLRRKISASAQNACRAFATTAIFPQILEFCLLGPDM